MSFFLQQVKGVVSDRDFLSEISCTLLRLFRGTI